MSNLIDLCLGPLAGPECHRWLGRRWTFWVRALAGVLAGLALLLMMWFWWVRSRIDPTFLPGPFLPTPLAIISTALTIVTLMTVVATLLLGPALLAGSLAVEKDQGTLELLLVSRVSSREIVSARLAGRLAQLLLTLAAVLPVIVALAALRDVSWWSAAALVGLPLAVGLGAGGLALLASVMARRARDALLMVYVAELMLICSSTLRWLGITPQWDRWIGPLNPLLGIWSAVDGHPTVAGQSIVVWSVLGVLSTAVTAWRLWPAYLAHLAATASSRNVIRNAAPPITHRPMLWKELHVEGNASFGRGGRLLGYLLVTYLLASSLVLGGMYLWAMHIEPDRATANWIRDTMTMAIARPAVFVGWLLQWSIGFRAAVTIASERQRKTWDALLTSPLEAGEIIWAKITGSLFALRALVAAAVLAWSIATLCGAMTVTGLATEIGATLLVGMFMAAVGVQASIASNTVTRAMAVTVSVWLVAAMLVPIAAMVLVALAVFAVLVVWAAQSYWMMSLGLPAPDWIQRFPFGFDFPYVITTLRLVLYAVAALAVAVNCRARFDRLVGRYPVHLATGIALPGGQVPKALPPRPAERRSPPDGDGSVVLEAATVDPSMSERRESSP